MPNTLPYGYRWFNGVILSRIHTDLYNTMLSDAARYEEAGFINAASVCHSERKNYLHMLFEFYLSDNSTHLNG